MMNYAKILLAGCSVLSLTVAAHAAAAQALQASPAPSDRVAQTGDTAPSELVVTARRRSERLLDVPVAVSALSAAAIQNQAIESLQDLANATPGFTVDSTGLGGSGRNDRSFPQYIIRGITPSTVTNPTTTVFIDGAPVVSGLVEGIDDLERIEVLKGPQSAYFGRETFAGAINLVTKDPSDIAGGSVSAIVGDRNYYDVRGSFEGPIIGDKLTGRITARYYTRDGSYENEAVGGAIHGTLGDQSTASGTIELVARPIDNLKIKLFGSYFHDDDGPSAQYLVGPSQANCLGNTFFCGVVQGRPAGQPAANDLVDGPVRAFLAAAGQPGVSLVKPLDHYGLERNAYHLSLGVDYQIPALGLTLSSLTAGDNQVYSELQDLDNADTSSVPNPFLAFASTPQFAQSYYNYPFLVEGGYRDFSQEFRVTSDQTKRFRYLVGVSYATSRADQTLGAAGAFGYFVYDAPTTTQNVGIFFGGTYDVFDKLTLSVEGRYQSDKQSATGEGKGGATPYQLSGTYDDFTPRVIAQYHITPAVMAYATYSEGVNPGTFNSSLSQLSPADLASIQSNYGASVAVRPEHIKNYEVGLKGRFFENTLTVAADAYYDVWTDQITVASVIYVEDGASKFTSANINNGASKIRGVEGDIAWRPIPHLDITLSGAINDTEITKGPCVTCSFYSGSTNVDGHELPDVSKYQSALGVQYGGVLTKGLPGWTWFARADDYFKSGSYEAADNLVRTPDSNILNLRLGLTHERVRLEAFVDNVTNEGAATNVSPFYNVANPFETYAGPDALLAGLPNLRTFGIRALYKFGY